MITGASTLPRVVKNALQIFKKRQKCIAFPFNFLSSYQLLHDLATQGFRATETMRNDRIIKYPVKEIKVINKE